MPHPHNYERRFIKGMSLKVRNIFFRRLKSHFKLIFKHAEFLEEIFLSKRS